jgi:hypothetical protein
LLNHLHDAFALAPRIDSHRPDVADRAPRLIAEPDPPGDRARMADEAVAVVGAVDGAEVHDRSI